MRRASIIIVLAALILLTFGFAVIKAGSLGDDGNWFNTHLRESFAKSPTARKIFTLNSPGDAAADYLANEPERIIIEVDVQNGWQLSPGALAEVEEQIYNITGKAVETRLSSQINTTADSFNNEELLGLMENNRTTRTSKNQAVFYLLLVSGSEENPGEIGTTLGAEGAAVFSKTVESLHGNTKSLEVSTILHEFLHQLGIGHVEDKNCIMNEAVEVGGYRSKISTDLCPAELDLLNQVRANY